MGTSWQKTELTSSARRSTSARTCLAALRALEKVEKRPRTRRKSSPPTRARSRRGITSRSLARRSTANALAQSSLRSRSRRSRGCGGRQDKKPLVVSARTDRCTLCIM